MSSPTPRKVPVCLPHDDDFLHRYQAKHGWDASPPPVIEWLDPDTQVIVEHEPSDDQGYVPRGYMASRRSRPRLPHDLDACIIEPHRRTSRQIKTWHARWPDDKVTPKSVREGKPDSRCRACRKQQRWARARAWPKRNWREYAERWAALGCRKHVVEKTVEAPHPDAGKVFSVFSTVKLYGLAPGTQVVWLREGEWARATIQEYVLWKAEKRKARKAKRKADNEHRRYLRQPAWYERVSSEDDWI